MRRFAAGVVIVLVSLAGAGCSQIEVAERAEPAAPEALAGPSQNCRAAFGKAAADIRNHYDTHPFYGPEYDALYADGVVDDVEQAQLDAWMAEDEALYNGLIDPVYDACTGWEDLYLGAYDQGPDSEWSLHGNEAISTDELKEIFVTTYCYENEARPACADFDISDW